MLNVTGTSIRKMITTWEVLMVLIMLALMRKAFNCSESFLRQAIISTLLAQYMKGYPIRRTLLRSYK